MICQGEGAARYFVSRGPVKQLQKSNRNLHPSQVVYPPMSAGRRVSGCGCTFLIGPRLICRAIILEPLRVEREALSPSSLLLMSFLHPSLLTDNDLYWYMIL